MTVQQAAFYILKEKGDWLTSRDIAQIIVEKNLVPSNAKDPLISFRGTIDKNIKGEKYNSPRLVKNGRKIGLPEWKVRSESEETSNYFENNGSTKRLSVELTTELLDKIQLASQAKIAATFDETLAVLIQKGLSASAPEIKQRLLKQLGSLS